MQKKMFSFFGARFIATTQEEEEDILAIFPRAKEIKYTILYGAEDSFDKLSDVVDNLSLVINNSIDEDNTAYLFVLVTSVFYICFIGLISIWGVAKRTMIKREFYNEEIDRIYYNTQATIKEKYEKTILKLAGVPNEQKRSVRGFK